MNNNKYSTYIKFAGYAMMSVLSVTMAESLCAQHNVRLRVPASISSRERPPRRVQLYNDVCRETMAVDEAHTGLAKADEVIPFTGKGVVVGVIDVGIDPRHPAFKTPQTDNSRVALYITTSSSLETSTGNFVYKAYNLADGQKLEKRFIDFSGDGHGTHTSCTAAGSNVGNPYYGMAPEATLVLTSMGSIIYEDEMMFGITAAMDYAREHNMPCVASLSLGGTSGMHDGTGIVTDVLASELSPGGQIVCFAAGNDGDNTSSLQRDFSENPEPLATILYKGAQASKCEMVDTYLTSPGDDLQVAFTLVRMTKEYCEEVWRSEYFDAFTMPADGKDILPELDGINSHLKEDGNLTLTYIKGKDGNNGLQIGGILPWIQEGEGYTIGLVFQSPGGHKVYAFTNYLASAFGSFGLDGYTRGNASESISDHCTSPYVISVGAVNRRESYADLQGRTVELDPYYGEAGGTARYSSYGSMPETLPHTMAPGTEVISALNERSTYIKVSEYTDNAGQDWYYGACTGTSMSTPALAGVIALWLQAEPTLTRADILELLDKTGNRELGGDRSQFGTPSAYDGLKLILEKQSSLIQPGVESATGSNPDKLMVRYLGRDRAELVVPFPCTEGEYILSGVDGRTVKTGHFTGNSFTLDLADEQGIYVVSVSTPQGKALQKIYSR